MKLNLFQRTTLGIALLLGLLLLCMATALLGLSRLHADTRQLADVEVAKVDHASQAAFSFSVTVSLAMGKWPTYPMAMFFSRFSTMGGSLYSE